MFYGANGRLYMRGNLNVSYLEQHLHYPISLHFRSVEKKKGTTHTWSSSCPVIRRGEKGLCHFTFKASKLELRDKVVVIFITSSQFLFEILD